MHARPSDTSPEAHAIQTAVYRHMGGAARVDVLFRLSTAVRALTLAGIHARHPEYTPEQAAQALARLTLGDDLVRRAWPSQPLVEP